MNNANKPPLQKTLAFAATLAALGVAVGVTAVTANAAGDMETGVPGAKDPGPINGPANGTKGASKGKQDAGSLQYKITSGTSQQKYGANQIKIPRAGQNNATDAGQAKIAPAQDGGSSMGDGSVKGLNPQPEPPGAQLPAVQSKFDAGSAQMLNPQPLPPKEGPGSAGVSGSALQLNPQPEPPGKGVGGARMKLPAVQYR